MTNISKFKDKRTLRASQNLSILIDNVRHQFHQLSHFSGQDFEALQWEYQTTTLFFSSLPLNNPRNPIRCIWPEAIANCVKAYVITHLWQLRLRRSPLSASRVGDLIQPIRFLIDEGLFRLEYLNYDTYWTAYKKIIDHYKRPTERLQDLNLFMKFLTDEQILKSNVDLISPHKNNLVKHKLPSVASPEKMPVPELVRAIIQLKWKVEEEYKSNPNHRTASDLLCVYTQAFQFGLGLRIGEVLRLPADCLIEYNGEMMCKVWTEKGMIPHARYIPEMWRPIFEEIMSKILEITAEYRPNAQTLEDSEVCVEIDERLNNFKLERKANAEVLFDELDLAFKGFEKEAKEAWRLKRKIKDSHEYTMEDLAEILPIFVSEKRNTQKANKYSKWGLNVKSIKMAGKGSPLYFYVTGKDIKDFINLQVKQRSNHLTQIELTSVIQGKQTKRDISRDRQFIEKSFEMEGSTAACYTFAPSSFKGKGRAPTAISREDAKSICEAYAHGSYDIENWIDILTFRNYFPEIPLLPSTKNHSFSDRNPELTISEKCKLSVLANTEAEGGIRYSINEGYLISQRSIKSYIKKRFETINYKIKKEINEVDEIDSTDESKTLEITSKKPKTITIQSRSFTVEQKVSDYLFLRADIGTGGTYPSTLTPQILSYDAVAYFFGGNDRYDNGFVKYKTDTPTHIAESWQSHKGRHWRTTSLFRAGVQESIINKWMGRTELQGRHYDHNTGSERAAEVGELMLEDNDRYLGEIPHRVKQFMKDEIPVTEIKEYLDTNMRTVQYTPLGYCVRSLNLNPCDLNMKCLVGADGNGCKHFIFDLKDDAQRERLISYRDKVGNELVRLFEVRDSGVAPVDAVNMHIEQQKPQYVNATNTLEQADKLLGTSFSETKTEFMPFIENGSYPDDCPFQCGDK